MKKLAYLIIVLLLAGCSHNYPLNANLNLQVFSQSQGIYQEGTNADINGKDSRVNPEVIIYRVTEGPAVKITNLNPPHILITERLAGGFREQGLKQESSSSVKIVLDVKELVATVTRPKLLYLTQANSRINLTLDNKGRTLTKNYNLESKRESVSKPDVDELEELLDTQLSDIVGQILADSSIKQFLKNG